MAHFSNNLVISRPVDEVFRFVANFENMPKRFTFEPAGSNTSLVDEWDLKDRLPGFVASLAAGRGKSAVAENLARLQQLLETGEVRLQDGRVERM